MLSLGHLKKVALMALLLGVMGTLAMPLAEDLYVEQQVTTSGIMGRPGTTSTQKLWMTKDMFRSDDPENYRSIIFRLDQNLILMLNTAQKSYQEASLEDFKEMMQMGAAMLGGMMEGGEMNLVKTGKSQKIGQWNCYQVLMEQPNMKIDMWITEEVSYDTTMFQKYLETIGGPFFSKKLIDQWAALKGYPIKSETSMTMGNMSMTTTTLVTSVSQTPIPKDLFSPPPDYKKVPFEVPRIPR